MITLYYIYQVGDCGDGCCSWDESSIMHNYFGYQDDVDTGWAVGAIFNREGLEAWCDRHADRLWWIINSRDSIPHEWDWRTAYEIDESMCEWA